MRVATAMGGCCFVVFSRYAVVGARECGACGEPSRASERGATQDRGLCVARRQKKNGGEPSHIMFVASLRCLLLLFCAYGICGRADVDAVAILHQSARARERERERERGATERGEACSSPRFTVVVVRCEWARGAHCACYIRCGADAPYPLWTVYVCVACLCDAPASDLHAHVRWIGVRAVCPG